VLQDLERKGLAIMGLNDWYGANATDLGIATLSFYETEQTYGVMVVPEESGDIDLPRVESYRVTGADHFAICKPQEWDALRCGNVLRLISQIKDQAVGPPRKEPLELYSLPRANPDFVGRADELARIEAALVAGGAAITAIEGMGGIGKTAAGVQVAHAMRQAGRFRDGVAFVDLDGFSATSAPKAPEAALAELLRPLVDAAARLPDDLSALQQLWRQRTATLDLLLFLDNARDEPQVEPLLPGHAGCRVLVTSRNRLALRGLAPIDLGSLEPAAAQTLALKLANTRWPDRLSADQAARLAELCAYLPLSIEVTASTLGQSQALEVERYLGQLAEATRPVQAMAQVKAVLRLSVATLAAPIRALWQQLGVLAGDFDRAAVAAVWEVAAPDETLAELERRSLVAVDERGRLHLHDLLRAVALEDLAAAPDQRAGAEARHARHYCAVLGAADDLYLAGAGQVLAGLRRYDAEQRQIAAGQAWAAAHMAKDATAARLAADYANAGVHVLALRLAPRARIGWLEAQAAACRQLGDRGGEGAALGNLGLAYADLGEARRALELYEQVLVIAREIGDRRGEGAALGNLGNAYAALGEARRALEHHEQALVISREIGDRGGEGNALNNWANALWKLGERARAIELMGAAAAIYEAIESPHAATARARLAEWTGGG
jgi:tetratricopeptide (TPR) repeat protein